ncbi:MAG TPA: hypothetical protein VNM92_13020 [Thermoanaerobaculia bacterium]|nr:hypothetical protein [Thermoanaerobaculia bacterium]
MRVVVRVTALLFCLLAIARSGSAVIVDRIAAVVERQIITLSEVNQIVSLKVTPRETGESDDDHRRRILDNLVAQSLRLTDVERFGSDAVTKDSIEARLQQLIQRFPSQADFERALLRSELTLDELRLVLKRQLQVDAYIEERFSPQIFVSLEEIDTFYRGTWSAQRRSRGLPIPLLAEATEEIRSLLKAERLHQEVSRWTSQLRSQANVDILAYR